MILPRKDPDWWETSLVRCNNAGCEEVGEIKDLEEEPSKLQSTCCSEHVAAIERNAHVLLNECAMHRWPLNMEAAPIMPPPPLNNWISYALPACSKFFLNKTCSLSYVAA